MKLPKFQIRAKTMDLDKFLTPLALVCAYLYYDPDTPEDISNKLINGVFSAVDEFGGKEMVDTFGKKFTEVRNDYAGFIVKSVEKRLINGVEEQENVHDS